MHSEPDDLGDSIGRILGALRPERRYLLSEWADEHRFLSAKGSAEPGRWRTSRTPYLREIMDCLTPQSPVEDIWVMKGAQLGFTELGVCWIGYVIDVTPGPMLFVQPSLDMAKRAAKQRIDPLVDETPRIRAKLPPKRSKDGGNAIFEKQFPGGILVLAGANSAASLRSMPARHLFLDEVDAYPGDIEGEGDPIQLAVARTRTFRQRKRFYNSTPTIRGASRIEAGFLETDQRRFFVPCPHCGEYQTIEWPRIQWNSEDLDEPAWLACEANGCVIEEREKGRMLAAGEWRPTAPENASPKRRGYHLSSLYSPLGWYSWSEARNDFLAAKTDVARLKAWTNTVLGETWVEKGDAPPWRRLYSRREGYKPGTVPGRGLLLTAGADVQKDRIEVEIRAWGPRYESWSVDYVVLTGDVADLDSPASPWRKLDDLLARPYPHELGADMPIACLAIDTGYETQTVYGWARRRDPRKVAPVKGADAAATLLGQPRYVDVTARGKRVRRGIRVWPVGVSIAKSELYGWLRQDEPTEGEEAPTGWVHWPQYNEEYFRQLTAEELVGRPTRTGHMRYEWVKRRERNEALDCAVYARAAAAIAGMDRMQPKHWTALRKQLAPAAATEPEVQSTPKPTSPEATTSQQPRPARAKKARKRRDGKGWFSGR